MGRGLRNEDGRGQEERAEGPGMGAGKVRRLAVERASTWARKRSEERDESKPIM